MPSVNTMIRQIHANALEHGWWPGPRKIGELVALINSEFSEALEEYRADRPMVWYACTMFEKKDEVVCRGCELDPKSCIHRDAKPEGIAVELIDGIIRIFDLFGAMGYECEGMKNIGGITEEVKMLKRYDAMLETYSALELPVLVALLQRTVCESVFTCPGNGYDSVDYQKFIEPLDLLRAVTIAVLWMLSRDVDVEKVLMEKHEYNKSRPYRHGNKKA